MRLLLAFAVGATVLLATPNTAPAMRLRVSRLVPRVVRNAPKRAAVLWLRASHGPYRRSYRQLRRDAGAKLFGRFGLLHAAQFAVRIMRVTPLFLLVYADPSALAGTSPQNIAAAAVLWHVATEAVAGQVATTENQLLLSVAEVIANRSHPFALDRPIGRFLGFTLVDSIALRLLPGINGIALSDDSGQLYGSLGGY